MRDWTGNCLGVVDAPLGTQRNHVAKVMVALQVVMLEKDLGSKKLWLEGDSLNIINCIKGKNMASWTIVHIIDKIKTILGTFQEVFITHVY